MNINDIDIINKIIQNLKILSENYKILLSMIDYKNLNQIITNQIDVHHVIINLVELIQNKLSFFFYIKLKNKDSILLLSSFDNNEYEKCTDILETNLNCVELIIIFLKQMLCDI